ncbi:MAG: SagB family peptide dehydrogenase [Elusimicrobia bacterium]|nr:SagB family peptide dehydrogenase [Elusimicrobiota bacterium]
MPEKLRRSSTLSLYWEDGTLVCEDYLTHRRAALNADMVGVLDRFSKPTEPERVISAARTQARALRGAVRQLRAMGFLKSDKSPAESRLSRWHWGHAAKHYLFGTKDAHRYQPQEQRLAYAKGLMKAGRQPPLYKSYAGRTKTRLSRPKTYASEANRTLSRVRNCRDYIGGPITKAALSEMLFLAWGEQEKIHPAPWGTLLEKTSYSGGNRHPVEVYPVIHDVGGMAPGLYHYNVRDHALELLKRGSFSRLVRRIGNGQEWLRGFSAAFLMTAVWSRTMFKYRHEYVSRSVFCDVGHLSQSLYLSANALGLGACTTYALDHSRAESFLGVDGIDESFVALSVVGRSRAA